MLSDFVFYTWSTIINKSTFSSHRKPLYSFELKLFSLSHLGAVLSGTRVRLERLRPEERPERSLYDVQDSAEGSIATSGMYWISSQKVINV